MELPKDLQIILQQFVEQYQVASWNITTSNKKGSIRITFKMADVSPQAVMKYRKVSPSYLRRLKKRSDQRNENNYESLCESNNRGYEKDECIKFTNEYINLLDYSDLLEFISPDAQLESCEQSSMYMILSLSNLEYISVEQSIFTATDDCVESSSNLQYSALVSYQQPIMIDESENLTADSSFGYAIMCTSETHDLSKKL